MVFIPRSCRIFTNAIITLYFLKSVSAGDSLNTTGYTSCGSNADFAVQNMDISYDKNTQLVAFDVSGTSTQQQFVTATLTVTAYGQKVYSNSFDPCDDSTKVQQLCPVPSGTFSAQGTQTISPEYADKIPSIAFSVPDLDGMAQLVLNSKSDGQQIACLASTVGNGKTLESPALSGVAMGIAGAALILSGISSLSALTAAGGSHPGVTSSSPTFVDVMSWFQSMAMNGMLSVNYPSVYRSYTRNFAFSGLLFKWDGLQTSIDNFRQSTGGNLTEESTGYLQNATLVYQGTNGTLAKRFSSIVDILRRDATFSQSSDTTTNTTSNSKIMQKVNGIEAYVAPFFIPKSNTFMTALMILAIVIGVIVAAILLFKLILELWALFGKFPKCLVNFRRRYWWVMAKTITQLILLLYGTWALYCVYQFVQGDSWGAKALAGVTLGIFTGIIAFFTWKIVVIAKKFKQVDGDANGLFENKETWSNYSIFYENYKKSYWWLFIPVIMYSFAKGVVIAAGDGHGLVQTGGQLILEGLMLVVVLFLRPFTRKSNNWINIVIQIVRVLSVICILVFVEQLGISETPKAITGVVLVAMQSTLTGLLAILIAANALINCCRANPHEKARKQAEKKRDSDNLTSLETLDDFFDRENYYRKSGYMQANSESEKSKAGTYEHTRSVSNVSLHRFLAPNPYSQSHARNISEASSDSRYSTAAPPTVQGYQPYRQPHVAQAM